MPKPPRPAKSGLAATGFAEQAGLLEQVDPPTPVPAAVGVDGHRARMRARLLASGPEALADYEILEMMLYIALPRRDTKALAKHLLERFKTFTGVVAAPISELRRVDGIGDSGIASLKTVHAAALRLARAEVMKNPVLMNWDALMDYLNVALARERVEQFRILFLDHRNRLIADEAQTRGTVNHTPVYPREVAKRALELNASALIIAHNHPSGDPTPSPADIHMTREIADAARAVAVTLHDHVVVGNGAWISFRREGLLG